jgi:CheY-like chemotaxis protein
MVNVTPNEGCAPQSPCGAHTGRRPNPLRVLVVDDDGDTVATLCTLLGLWGMSALSARDGAAALEVAARQLPDVILVDLSMPGMDGYELMQEIRSQPHLQHTKIVVLSGFGREDFVLRSHQLGADLHLVKPVNLDSLQRFLWRVVPRKS